MTRDTETLLMEAMAIVQTCADATEQDYIAAALTVAADKIDEVLQAATDNSANKDDMKVHAN